MLDFNLQHSQVAFALSDLFMFFFSSKWTKNTEFNHWTYFHMYLLAHLSLAKKCAQQHQQQQRLHHAVGNFPFVFVLIPCLWRLISEWWPSIRVFAKCQKVKSFERQLVLKCSWKALLKGMTQATSRTKNAGAISILQSFQFKWYECVCVVYDVIRLQIALAKVKQMRCDLRNDGNGNDCDWNWHWPTERKKDSHRYYFMFIIE